MVDLRRGLSPAQLAALDDVIHPVLLAFVDWPDDPVYAHSGVGTITWAGHDFLGVGDMAGFDLPSEAADGVTASEAILSLIGAPADLNGRLDDAIRGRAVDLWIGFLTDRPDRSSTLIGEPLSLFSGTLDGLDLTSTVDQGALSHEARLAIATGPGARSMASISHSDEDQRRRHPEDTAGRLVILSWARAQKLTWPES